MIEGKGCSSQQGVVSCAHSVPEKTRSEKKADVLLVYWASFPFFIPTLHLIACLFLLNDDNVFMDSGKLGRGEQTPANKAFNHSGKKSRY